MKIQPRPYAGLDDLEKMKAIVVEGRKVSLHSAYPHIGDLNWWLYYGVPVHGHTPPEVMTLWEDQEGQVIGWVYMDNCEFDMVLLPAYRGGAVEAQVTQWAVESLTLRAQAEKKPVEAFAYADDSARRALLESMGCLNGSDYLAYFSQTLTAALPEARLPEGFYFLDAMRPEYADRRADVHFNAFRASRMTTEAYRHFMTAPDYDPTLDIVVVAPDGQFAAFAMGWIDSKNKLSVFEPVGTRETQQRRGLGRAALLEGLRRLQARGVEVATVCAHPAHEGTLAFYRSAGFQLINRILVYSRAV